MIKKDIDRGKTTDCKSGNWKGWNSVGQAKKVGATAPKKASIHVIKVQGKKWVR